MTYKLTVTTLALTAITSTVAATHAKPDTEHPHIVLILCDDMGFSDLSCYGGEIHTPSMQAAVVFVESPLNWITSIGGFKGRI